MDVLDKVSSANQQPTPSPTPANAATSPRAGAGPYAASSGSAGAGGSSPYQGDSPPPVPASASSTFHTAANVSSAAAVSSPASVEASFSHAPMTMTSAESDSSGLPIETIAAPAGATMSHLQGIDPPSSARTPSGGNSGASTRPPATSPTSPASSLPQVASTSSAFSSATGSDVAGNTVASPSSSSFSSTALAIVVIGMAGSGKSTFVGGLQRHLTGAGKRVYTINLDPAAVALPYESVNIDIRDTVNYKKVMQHYRLGPNGGILTALNLFATKFGDVLTLLEQRKQTHDYILLDTPGQIEAFTWSASGSIILESLAASLPTCICYILDTPRCSRPVTFMSNMLYSCSVLYKARLPFIGVFNKTDVASHLLCQKWMTDYDAFQGMKGLEQLLDKCRIEYETDFLAFLREKRKANEAKAKAHADRQLAKFMRDHSSSATAGLSEKTAQVTRNPPAGTKKTASSLGPSDTTSVKRTDEEAHK